MAGYRYQYGLALERAGDAAAAVESLKEAGRLEPNRPATLVALGAALTRALAAEPGSAKAHCQLSLAWARLYDEAAVQQHLSLYRREVEKGESRLRQVRDLTGFSPGGMQR